MTNGQQATPDGTEDEDEGPDPTPTEAELLSATEERDAQQDASHELLDDQFSPEVTMSNAVDRFMNWLVGDRCPADPCASQNGLKTRTYAVVLLPTLAFGAASGLLTPGSLLARGLMGLAAAWFMGTLLVIPRRIDQLEACNEVAVHYGEKPGER